MLRQQFVLASTPQDTGSVGKLFRPTTTQKSPKIHKDLTELSWKVWSAMGQMRDTNQALSPLITAGPNPSFLSGSAAHGGPWPSQEAFLGQPSCQCSPILSSQN
ncbi:hypothetical protein TNCV_2954471 [Trichonephila clavipes]|nr:hypothetical protein TNCV_2954471 [Trichonephila clavipes]